jgi:predicted tellurium resistance membrane protein TerC
MATKVKRKNVKTAKKASVSPFNNYWQKVNYIILGLGVIVIILGFYLMSMGSWNSVPSLVISPILLFIGFAIIIPVSIFYNKKSDHNSDIKP